MSSQFSALLLNTITDVNHIKSVFSQCQLQQSKVTNKTMTLNNIETNKINKKQSKMILIHMICYTYIKILNVNIFLLTFISNYAAVFTTSFKWNNPNFSCLFHYYAILTSCKCHANG